MISFFTMPKAFKGHIGLIQENAIKSWLALTPRPEIFLLGNENGVSEISKKYNLRHIKNIKSGNKSIPILSDIFEKIHHYGKESVICYINSDIILFDDFSVAIKEINQRFKKYLAISSRWNLDIDKKLNFKNSSEIDLLREAALNKKDMYPAAGSDFFVFPRNSILQDIPPFLLGRGYWDNWLMYKAKKEGASLVDITPDVVALHQNHEYTNHNHSNEKEITIRTICRAEEGQKNLQLAGGLQNIYCAYDADYVLSGHKIHSSWSIRYVFRRIKSSLRRIVSVAKGKLQ